MDEGQLSAREREILEERTRAFAAPAAEREERATESSVRVRVGRERFALESSVVQGVLSLRRITPLPHAPAHVAGIVVHVGTVLPVFHLRAVLELPLEALPERGHVVLLGERVAELALIVDELEELSPVHARSLQPPPASLGAGARALVRGADASGVPLLDGAKLLASERLYVDIPVPHLDLTKGKA